MHQISTNSLSSQPVKTNLNSAFRTPHTSNSELPAQWPQCVMLCSNALECSRHWHPAHLSKLFRTKCLLVVNTVSQFGSNFSSSGSIVSKYYKSSYFTSYYLDLLVLVRLPSRPFSLSTIDNAYLFLLWPFIPWAWVLPAIYRYYTSTGT